MDLSSLAPLGKIAGIAGLAIGLVALVARQVIAKTSSLPKGEQGATLRLIMLGAFAIGALGIVAWIGGGAKSVTVTGGACGVASGGDASGNSVSCGAVPAGVSAGVSSKP